LLGVRGVPLLAQFTLPPLFPHSGSGVFVLLNRLLGDKGVVGAPYHPLAAHSGGSFCFF